MMKKIASHDNIDIFAPGNSRFSFLKSPYAAHRTFSAVDIYYGSFGSEAFSPVTGKVIDIRKFDSPTPFKNRDFPEYIIAIQQEKYVIKILHVEPEISEEDIVSKGDRIGNFIRNGYFIFWNDPVVHVEVRHPDDYLRASNNLCLKPSIEWNNLPYSGILEIDCRVKEINDKYALLSAPYETCGNLKGFPLKGGFLDGYVSTDRGSGFFGIIHQQGHSIPELLSIEITKDGSEIECAGISFCLNFRRPFIKVIPVSHGKRPFSPGDAIHIRIEVL